MMSEDDKKKPIPPSKPEGPDSGVGLEDFSESLLNRKNKVKEYGK